ncbi:MAG: phosphotransferase [bacterium]
MERSIDKIIDSLGIDGAKVTLLAGDASTRKYYRIQGNSKSLILMHGDAFDENDSNVLSIESYLEMGVRVPSIHKIFQEQGILVQEDIGDVHLQSIKDKDLLKKYYKDAISQLIKLQRTAFEYQTNGKEIYPLKIKFTHEKFMSELNMTSNYYIKVLSNKNITEEKELKLNDLYKSIVDEMMKQTFLVQHRDYHSRNLMIHKNNVYMIDIQDTRLGPFTYDIASLMIDPYIELEDSLYNEIKEQYYDSIKDIVKCTHDEYSRFCDVCLIQRGIKILGTFAYQKIEKGKASYLPYIPISISRLKDALVKFPEWEKIIVEEVL